MAPPKPREDVGRRGPKYDTKEDKFHLKLVILLYLELLELCSFKWLSHILTMTHNKNLALSTL